MKEFLNKLKTPTKILSIVCFVLVIMLFRKCNEANRSRDKCNQLTEQRDQLTEQRDSLLNEIQELNNLIKDLKLENALNNGNKLESKHEMEIKLIKCEAKLKECEAKLKELIKREKDYENKFSYQQRVINNLKKKN